jgi:aromatic-L-amino-acid/L-tryptophan decarboxylase
VTQSIHSHMTPEEFRQYGRLMVDWIADYYENIERYPVLSQVKPGEIRARLPEAPPQKGEAFEDILKDISRVILPGITHWQSPNFFAFFPANTSGPAILGDLLSSGLGVQGMLWATSPACTELETLVMDWMADLLGLPPKFKSSGSGGGVIQDSASSATLTAILAARERATDCMTNENGADAQLVAYTSTQAHSSVEKGLKIAGYGRKNLRLIEVDDNYAMRSDLLVQQIEADLQNGLKPAFVAATIGTTSSNGIDPIAEIGVICRRYHLWLHVDAAMSGAAAICPEYQFLLDGIEFTDSFCFNPHKWMFTNFDCDCFFVADRSALIQTLSILPEYLRNQASQSGAVIDYRDWQIPLGRRFRSLKLWFVLRSYGVEGLQYHIRQHIAMAHEFADWVRNDPRFELDMDPPLNLVCFRHRGGDAFNMNLLEQLNRSGELYLTHTVLKGQYTLRMSIGQTKTEERHVASAWKKIRDVTAELEKLTL